MREFAPNVREFAPNVREFAPNVREFAPNVREFSGPAEKLDFLDFSGFLAENFKSDEKSETFEKSKEIFGVSGFWAK